MKLNLGGRDKPIPGFLTVDLYEGPGVDVKSDIGALSGIEDGSVDEIYASHCLEHFSHTKTLDVLKSWRRVLKPGAKAFIAVPDFDAMIRLYQKIGFTDFIRNMLFGDQGYDLAYHYTAFNFLTLAAALINAGFNDVKKIGNMPYGLNDCSSKRDSFFRIPTSLNVEAVA